MKFEFEIVIYLSSYDVISIMCILFVLIFPFDEFFLGKALQRSCEMRLLIEREINLFGGDWNRLEPLSGCLKTMDTLKTRFRFLLILLFNIPFALLLLLSIHRGKYIIIFLF